MENEPKTEQNDSPKDENQIDEATGDETVSNPVSAKSIGSQEEHEMKTAEIDEHETEEPNKINSRPSSETKPTSASKLNNEQNEQISEEPSEKV